MVSCVLRKGEQSLPEGYVTRADPERRNILLAILRWITKSGLIYECDDARSNSVVVDLVSSATLGSIASVDFRPSLYMRQDGVSTISVDPLDIQTDSPRAMNMQYIQTLIFKAFRIDLCVELGKILSWANRTKIDL